MNALDAFEHRKEQLADALAHAGSMQEAIAACTMALEQTACELAQEEQGEQARQRQQAVMAALRLAPQLLFAAEAEAELVIPQSAAAPADKKQKTARTAGAFLLAALAVYEMIDGQMLFAMLQLAGGVLLGFGLRSSDVRSAQARGVMKVNAGEMIRKLSALCRAADVCTGDLALLDRNAGMARIGGTADEATIDLLVALMEAKASGRDEVAMRSLAQAEQYLHMLGVEVVYYSEAQAAHFDVLPTMGEARTIRPALIRDGKVLRRGMAACRIDRMEGGAGL